MSAILKVQSIRAIKDGNRVSINGTENIFIIIPQLQPLKSTYNSYKYLNTLDPKCGLHTVKGLNITERHTLYSIKVYELPLRLLNGDKLSIYLGTVEEVKEMIKVINFEIEDFYKNYTGYVSQLNQGRT